MLGKVRVYRLEPLGITVYDYGHTRLYNKPLTPEELETINELVKKGKVTCVIEEVR